MKLLILALVTFSYCCSAAQILQNSDESLQTFIQTLPQTLSVDLNIKVQEGRVEVVGRQNDIQKLQDFLNNKDNLFTAHFPQAQPFVTKFDDEKNTLTWERFLSCIGLETTSSGLCGSQFKDQEGSALSISGKNNSGNMIMAKGYFQTLKEENVCFSWLYDNLDGFYTETTEGENLTIHLYYGLAKVFLQSNFQQDPSDPSNTSLKFSTQDFVNRMVMLNGGNVLLEKDNSNDDSYHVKIIQHHNAPPQEFTLKLLVDTSGSMKNPNNPNNPNDKRSRLDVAKEHLPKFINQLFAHLSIGQTVNVELIEFNEKEYVTASTLKKENKAVVNTSTLTDKINSLSPDCGTDLNIVTQNIQGERGILICCTDGLQSSNCGTFRGDLDSKKPFLETYVLSVAPNETDNDFFKKIKGIGASIATAQNVDTLFQEILTKIPQMAIGSEAYQILKETLEASIVRIPRKIGIYDTGQQAQNGDSIKHVASGAETKIQQRNLIPLVNNPPQKKEESTHNKTTNSSWFSALFPQAQNWSISSLFSSAKKKIIG